MNPELLKKFIENTTHKGYLERITKPSVDITYTGDPANAEQSRFGGQPLVPKNFEWPSHEVGEYRFLGQFNFAEISGNSAEIPNSGLLSLFYAYDEDGEIFWGDDGFILGYYWPTTTHLELAPKKKSDHTSKGIALTHGLEIPRYEDLRDDWPFDTELLYGLQEQENLPDNYLLGYPSFCTLAYDPTPSQDWISLLTLNSDDDLDWCWHDGDKLMIFVEKTKLKDLDFSYLKADAG